MKKVKMINTNYANAYKEILVVINNLIKEDYEKIPKEYIEFLKTNANPDYNFEYNTSRSLKEQELLDDTKYILFGLFEKYGATDVQKSKIKSFKDSYNEKLEKEKIKKYNLDDIFKKNDLSEDISSEKNENTQIVEYKEQKWYEKLSVKILKIFKK